VIGEGTGEERRARAAVALGLGYRLPEGGLGRVLALWGFAGVPSFRASGGPAADYRAAPLPCAGERNGPRPPSGVSGTGGPDGG